MRLHVLVGAAAILMVGGLSLLPRGTSPAAATTAPVLAAPPAATAPAAALPPNGHFVLVVEGDRDALAITHANRKPDPWAGVPKGLRSAWTLTVRDGQDAVLAEVPLDVTPFATDVPPQAPVQVTGCVVRSPRIGMLVSVPAFAQAASYSFARRDGDGQLRSLGVVDGEAVRTLAGGGR